MNKITYSRTTNLGDFNSERIEYTIEYEELGVDAETADSVFEEAKTKVMAWSEQPVSKPTVTRTGGISLEVDKEPPLCEKCDSPMTEKTNTKEGTKFWGCSRYPDCNFTKNI